MAESQNRDAVSRSEDLTHMVPKDKIDEDIILLTLPLKAEYVQLARLAVAGLEARAALGHEEIMDIKLAVSEACTCVLRMAENTGDGSRPAHPVQPALTVQFHLSGEEWQISVSAAGVTSSCALDLEALPPLSEDALRVTVMQALVDRVDSFSDETGWRYLRLMKRLP